MSTTRRRIKPQIIPGKSITRIYQESPLTFQDGNVEIHVSHYPEGDLSSPPQWYDILEVVTPKTLDSLRVNLSLDKEDWNILEHLLGSFSWVMIRHHTPLTRNELMIDEEAMRSQEWSRMYF